ncbi:MAG: Ig-like domain-containing protein [Bacteroidaceae bacterium]|nr:Ig-like domain-containing protein [Bacteroidaceae bacterium]
MKKIINLSMLAIAAMAAFACTEEIVDPESNEIPSVENPLVINALADDDIAPDTKTSLSGVSIRWATTDAIAGYEGSTKHTSTKTDISDGGKLATFTFSGVSVGTNLDYLIYPAAAAGAEDAGLFEITLPTEQEATADSFADGANVALAEGKVADDAVLFKNLGALIGIKVNNDNIESVKISANEDMTGAGIADPSDFSAIADSGEKYVQLTGGLNNGEDYYAVVYPSPLAGYTGLQIVAENTVGQTATYSNSTPLVLARNDNKRIANLTIAPAKWTPSYESWTYTFTSKQFSSNTSVTLNGKSWTLNGDGDYWNYESNRGQQFGSGTKPYTGLTLTSNFGVSAGVRAVTVSAAMAKDANATLSVSVGGVDYKYGGSTTADLTTTNTAYEFVSPTGKVKTGNIVISIDQSTSKAVYIKTITVNGKASPEISFSTDSYSFVIGSSDYLAFTGQALTNPNSVTIVSYESSDTSIATVDSDGNVTLKGKIGSTTITATSEENFTYAASTASYDITVSPEPTHVSSVTAAGDYKIEDLTVMAVSGRSIIAADATGAILIYAASADHGKVVNDVLTVNGSVVSYHGVWEFSSPTITKTGTTTAIYPSPIAYDDSQFTSYTSAPVIEYASASGVASSAGRSVTSAGGKVYNVYGDLSSVDGKSVIITGYVFGYNSPKVDFMLVGAPTVDPTYPTLETDPVDGDELVWADDKYGDGNAKTIEVTLNGSATGYTVSFTDSESAWTVSDDGAGIITAYPKAANGSTTTDKTLVITITHKDNALLTSTISLKQNKKGAPATKDYYRLVTDTEDITAGTYVVGALRSASATDTFYFGKATVSSGDWVVSDDYITVEAEGGIRRFETKDLPSGAVEFTFTGNNTDGFTISNSTNYLYYTAASNRKLSFAAAGSSQKWKVSAKSSPLITGGIVLKAVTGDSTNYTISENSTGVGAIRGYASTTEYRAIYLFKKVNE